MKKLLLTFLMIPNLVLADTYLCVSDASAGTKYDIYNDKYESVAFSSGRKNILKTGNENRFYKFGKDTYETRAGEVKYKNLFSQVGGKAECDETREELICKINDGYFRFHFAKLKYVTVSHSGYFTNTKNAVPNIEIGTCSKI